LQCGCFVAWQLLGALKVIFKDDQSLKISRDAKKVESRSSLDAREGWEILFSRSQPSMNSGGAS